jgi:hypothetical protein
MQNGRIRRHQQALPLGSPSVLLPLPSHRKGRAKQSSSGDGGGGVSPSGGDLFLLRQWHGASWFRRHGAAGSRGVLHLLLWSLASGFSWSLGRGGPMRLASRRHGGAPAAVARSFVPAQTILCRAGLQILGFCSGQVRSCLRRRSLGTMTVSAVGQAAVVWIPPSSSVQGLE